MVADGKAVLCEVKPSWASTRPTDIPKLVELAKRLHPDLALFAVMEETSEMNGLVTEATARLALEGVRFELLPWKPEELLDGPYLPSA